MKVFSDSMCLITKTVDERYFYLFEDLCCRVSCMTEMLSKLYTVLDLIKICARRTESDPLHHGRVFLLEAEAATKVKSS